MNPLLKPTEIDIYVFKNDVAGDIFTDVFSMSYVMLRIGDKMEMNNGMWTLVKVLQVVV